MNRKEYYNRVKKTRIKGMTDRTSRDEDYQISCQINYLSNRYIETLENALDEIEKYIENHKRESESHIYGLTIPKFIFDGDIEDVEEIIEKVKGE